MMNDKTKARLARWLDKVENYARKNLDSMSADEIEQVLCELGAGEPVRNALRFLAPDYRERLELEMHSRYKFGDRSRVRIM